MRPCAFTLPRPPFSTVSAVILCRSGDPPRKPALKNQNEIFPKPSPGWVAGCCPVAVGGSPARNRKSRYDLASRRARERKRGVKATASKELQHPRGHRDRTVWNAPRGAVVPLMCLHHSGRPGAVRECPQTAGFWLGKGALTRRG